MTLIEIVDIQAHTFFWQPPFHFIRYEKPSFEQNKNISQNFLVCTGMIISYSYCRIIDSTSMIGIFCFIISKRVTICVLMT